MGNRAYFLRFLAPHSRVGPSEAGSNGTHEAPVGRGAVIGPTAGPGIASSVQGPQSSGGGPADVLGPLVVPSQEALGHSLERVALGIGTSHGDGHIGIVGPLTGRPAEGPAAGDLVMAAEPAGDLLGGHELAWRPQAVADAQPQQAALDPVGYICLPRSTKARLVAPARATRRNLVAMMLACPAAVAPRNRVGSTPQRARVPHRGAHGLGNARRRNSSKSGTVNAVSPWAGL
jgi:hypothetical protein